MHNPLRPAIELRWNRLGERGNLSNPHGKAPPMPHQSQKRRSGLQGSLQRGRKHWFEQHGTIMSHSAALDWLNFLLADVRGGLGPYVSVYLLTVAGWNAGTIGTVLMVSGITGITMHAPIGALIDATRA